MGLGQHLYEAFWSRNENAGPVPPWERQALAIRMMWLNIAASAIKGINDGKS